MKRIFLLIAAIFIVSIPSLCLADSSITENADMNMVINGETAVFNDPIIVQNGRTMLPLRELLTSLGVQNDNEHIVWNENDKSIMFIKDTTKVALKLQSSEADINGTKTTLDAAPVIYTKNGRTYIPVRFVAQALGKKVAWDDNTKSVFIGDESNYKNINEILGKSCDAMAALKRYKCEKSVKITGIDGNPYLKRNASALVQIDQENKIAKNEFKEEKNGRIINLEFWLTDNSESR